MFTEEQIKLMKDFYYQVFRTSLPAEEMNGDMWKQQYWVFEAMENLILGEDRYLKGDHPVWLYKKPEYRIKSNNRLFISFKRKMFQVLCDIKDNADHLLVCEVGYGMDILLASMVKTWKSICCYDGNPHLESHIMKYFGEMLGLNIQFEHTSSNMFRFDKIENKTIVISNITHIRIGEPSERIRNNSNLIYLRNGELMEYEDMPLTEDECRSKYKRGWF